MKILNALTPKLVTSAGVKSEYISAAIARKNLTVVVQHGTIGAGKNVAVKVLNATSISGVDHKELLTVDIGGETETAAGAKIIDIALSGEMSEYFAIELSGNAEALYCSALFMFNNKYSD